MKNKRLLKQHSQKSIIATLKRELDKKAVFFKKRPKGISDILGLTSSLSKKTGREVDLIVLNDADIMITMQILANGKLMINHLPSKFIEFKARKMSEYLDFKISRRRIEENLLRGI